MKEQIIIANPYNENHIKLFQEYEQENNITNQTSEYLLKIKNMMSESDYRQLEHEKPEIVQILFLLQNNKIVSAVHLIGEKDRKVCRMAIDNTTLPKYQERLLEEAENYAYTTLGMEEIAFFQESGNRIPISYFKNHNFDDLGMENGKRVFMKSKAIDKLSEYQM